MYFIVIVHYIKPLMIFVILVISVLPKIGFIKWRSMQHPIDLLNTKKCIYHFVADASFHIKGDDI